MYNVVDETGGDIKKIIKNKTLKNLIRFCIVIRLSAFTPPLNAVGHVCGTWFRTSTISDRSLAASLEVPFLSLLDFHRSGFAPDSVLFMYIGAAVVGPHFKMLLFPIGIRHVVYRPKATCPHLLGI